MDKITNLYQTAEIMSSENYKERFVAEYCQIAIRTLRLERVLINVANGTAPKCFKLSCPFALLQYQLRIMNEYKALLVNRAMIEDIDLPEVDV